MGRNGAGEKRITEWVPKNWSFIFILFLAILGIYYQSLYYPFSNLDDPFYIHGNPYIRDLTLKGLWNIFSKPIVANYFPLQILSFAVDYRIWNIQPFGYHLHNVLLHFLNAVLVFFLLKKIFSNLWVSFFAALLFGLHPVNVESVTWVAERKNVLSLALMLSSFSAYLYYVEERRPTWKKAFYLMAFFLFLLSLLTKVSAVVLPFLFILYDLCFQKRTKWGMVKDKIPFFFLALLFSVLTVWIYHSGKYLVSYHGGSPYATFLAMINVFVEYIIYLIVPIYLDHLYWTPVPQTIFERQVLLSMAAIVLLALLAWWSFRKDRVFFFWMGWFFISLLPVLNIVPLAILRADRYMYLPAIGFFYLVSAGLWHLFRGGYRTIRLPVFIIVSFLLAGSYAYLTVERNKLWRDPIIFWEENLKKFPQSVQAYRFMGNIYLERGKYDLAFSYLQAGLQENPDSAVLLNSLAIAYKKRKDLKKAEELLLLANRLDPKESDPYNNLGVIYIQKGDMEKAKSYLQRAIQICPQHAAARVNLGVISYHSKQWEDAIGDFKKAMDLSPGSIEPYLNLALIYEQKGLADEAESYLKRSLEYNPNSHPALAMLGRICYEQGRILEAKNYLNRAVRLKPDDEKSKFFLAIIAEREKNPHFNKAVSQAPNKRFEPLIQDTGGHGKQ